MALLPDNEALNQIRETTGQTQDQVTVTDTSSDKTYGDWLDENPAIEAVEKVASGGSISDDERNTTLDKVKESIQESTGNFRETVEEAGVDPEEAFHDSPDIPDNTDLGDIWDQNTPDLDDTTQQVQDLVRPNVGLIPNTPDLPETDGIIPEMPEIKPEVNLGIGKAAKYGAAAAAIYIIVKEVL